MTQNNDMSNLHLKLNTIDVNVYSKSLSWLKLSTICMLLTAFLLLSGCSQSPEKVMLDDDPIAQFALPNVNIKSSVITKLYQQYSEWKGVPYQENGSSKSGTDCSGFVVETYKTQFGVLVCSPVVVRPTLAVGHGKSIARISLSAFLKPQSAFELPFEILLLQ